MKVVTKIEDMDRDPFIVGPYEVHASREGTRRLQSFLLHSSDCERSQRSAESSDDVRLQLRPQDELMSNSDAYSVEMQEAALTESEWVDKVGVSEWLDDVGVRVIQRERVYGEANDVGETEWLDDVGVASRDAGEASPDISCATPGQPVDCGCQFHSENPSNDADFTDMADSFSASKRSEDEAGQKKPFTASHLAAAAALMCLRFGDCYPG